MLSLYGHGYIGSAIAKELAHQSVQFDWQHHGDKPSCWTVINAAGFTGDPNVDGCEDHKRECIEANILWPLSLERSGCVVVHIGSGCLYQGGPFSEDDAPNFTGSFYSLCKAIAQDRLKPFMGQSYLLRARMPFGRKAHPKNLLTKLRRYPSLVNHVNSMTNIDDLARAAVFFATKKPPRGVYNLVNPGAIATRDLAEMMGLKGKRWVDEVEFVSMVRAPRSACVLTTAKLEAVFPIRPLREALEECL